MSSFSDFAKRWEAWGLPAIISVLAPWYEKVFAFPLISAYWQPNLNIFCALVGTIVAVITFVLFSRKPKKKVRHWLFGLMALLCAALVLCLILRLIVGVTFFPGAQNQWIVWFGWIIAYVGIFTGLSGTLVLAILLAPTSTRRTNP